MSKSPPKRPRRRVRSVPVQLNFLITPLTTAQSSHEFTSTSGTGTPSPNGTSNDNLQPRKRGSRRNSRSSGSHTPTSHSTATACEGHPPAELKRSSSTFFLSSLPAYQHDWKYLHGARVAAERLEQEGRSWLVSRASSTDLVGHVDLDSDEEYGIYHRHARDLEILELGTTLYDVDKEPEQEEEYNWNTWIKAFLEFGEESDDENGEWKPPRRRTVAFVDMPGKGREVDENTVQRVRERDDEHGMDGWMDGAVYLAFLGVRALGGFF